MGKAVKKKNEEKVVPLIDNVIQRSYEALKKGKLLGIRCKKCGTYGIAAYGYVCPHCGGFDVEEVKLSGKGKLLPCSTVVYPMEGIVEKHYIAATVQLEEGPIITARLYVPDFDYNKPSQILDLIGMELKMDIRKETVLGRVKGQYCICFVPVK